MMCARYRCESAWCVQGAGVRRLVGACLEVEQGERAERKEHSDELAADARLSQ